MPSSRPNNLKPGWEVQVWHWRTKRDVWMEIESMTWSKHEQRWHMRVVVPDQYRLEIHPVFRLAPNRQVEYREVHVV